MKLPKCKEMQFCMLGDLADHIGCRTPECPPLLSRSKGLRKWDIMISGGKDPEQKE